MLNFAEFYALMPPDNATAVAPDEDVLFPRDGAASGDGIARSGPGAFTLAEPGVYQVLFVVTTNQSAQLVLTLNGEALPWTVVGRNSGGSQVTGMALVVTEEEDAVLTVRNPAENPPALIITPDAGGTQPVSAHLIILQLR